MRHELLGPLPLVLGLAIVAGALLSPTRAPPPPECSCSVELFTPSEFAALDASNYGGTAAGALFVVDGRVADIEPSPLVAAPFRWVTFEGSVIRFNVTNYNAATGPVGEWVRITATNDGSSEKNGPDQGHRWAYGGRTAPAGNGVVSLAALALGIAVAGWGAATWKEAGKARARARDLRERADKARAACAADPAASKAPALYKEIAAAGTMVRRGQYDSAQTALEAAEAQLARARKLGEAIAAAREALETEVRAGFTGGKIAGVLDEAVSARAEGDVPEAEKVVASAMATLANLRPLRELIEACGQSLEASGGAGVEDPEAAAWLENARQLLSAGEVDKALEEAERAHRRARAISPRAKEARAEIERLKDFLALRTEFDRTREVRDRVRDADELYRLGMFGRALAEARVGVWLADAESLSAGEFEAIVRSHYSKHGYELDPKGAVPPPLGFLAVRGGETAVIVTSAWRDFPGERIMFALKDFFAEGGAARAVVYSSAFTNTSTDARIEVVDAAAVVELLRDAALAMTA